MTRSIKDFVPKTKQEIAQNVNNEYDKYSKMNENQLQQEMAREVSRLKREGKLDTRMLDDFYNAMSSNLTSEQRNKLKTMINEIK